VRDEEGEHRCAQGEVDQIPSKTVGCLLYRSARTFCIFDRFDDLAEGCLFPETLCATFAEKRYKFEEGQALMVAVDIPSRGTVTVASTKKPYLGIAIELDFGIMQAVAEEIEIALTVSGKPKARGAFVLDLDRSAEVYGPYVNEEVGGSAALSDSDPTERPDPVECRAGIRSSRENDTRSLNPRPNTETALYYLYSYPYIKPVPCLGPGRTVIQQSNTLLEDRF
jgi:hypothetical protein